MPATTQGAQIWTDMKTLRPEKIEDAEVVLHLEIKVSQENRSKFLDFCHKAFPIYESIGGNRMALYENKSALGHFDEVGYYESFADYKRSENAIKNDPVQSALIKEWRTLLKSHPKVTVFRKERIAEASKIQAGKIRPFQSLQMRFHPSEKF